jgi:hypothetical protein
MAIDLLDSAHFVCARSQHVTIQGEALPRLACKLLPIPLPPWDLEHHFCDGSERTVAYCLLLDALNFCFFPEPRWEVVVGGKQLQGYYALAAVLKQAFGDGSPIDDFAYLARIDAKTVHRLLQGPIPIGQIPLLEKRGAILREIGRQVTSLYGGRPARLLEISDGRAQRLINLIVESFSSFRDEARYAKRRIAFYKRAQIFIADLFASFQGSSFGTFCDLDRLTAFADYKLPQILRAEGILSYSKQLADRVDHKEWIEAGSPEEVEIRAASIVAVERLRQELAQQGRNLLAIEVDWLLWNAAQHHPDMPPHHRTLTTFY